MGEKWAGLQLGLMATRQAVRASQAGQQVRYDSPRVTLNRSRRLEARVGADRRVPCNLKVCCAAVQHAVNKTRPSTTNEIHRSTIGHAQFAHKQSLSVQSWYNYKTIDMYFVTQTTKTQMIWMNKVVLATETCG